MLAKYEMTAIEDGGTGQVHDVSFTLPGFIPPIGWTIALWKALSSTIEVKRVIYCPLDENARVLLSSLRLPVTQYAAFLEFMRREYAAVVETVDPC